MLLIALALAWALGLSLARGYAEMGAGQWLLLGAIAILLLRVGRLRRWRQLAAISAAFTLGGARLAILPDSSALAEHNGFSGTVTGIVVAEPVLRDDRVQLRLQAEEIFVHNRSQATSGLLLVEARRGVDVAYGDRLRATGALEMPRSWDRFSYADYLGRQGLFSIMRNAALDILQREQGAPLHMLLLRAKASAKRGIADALPEPQASLLTGILLGDESGISPHLKEDFARVGASHVIAISGFNMIVVSTIVLRLFMRLLPSRRRAAIVCALTVVAAYTLFVGAGDSVLRAAWMSGLLIVGHHMRRRAFVPSSLAAATLIMAVLDPHVLLDIGFQLSFCAVMGLALFVRPLSEALERLLLLLFPLPLAFWLNRIMNEPVAVTLAAQLTVMPLVLLYFGRLSLVTVPVNGLIVPVQTPILVLGLAATLLGGLVPALGTWLYWAILPWLSWTIEVVRRFARLSFADIALDADSRLIVLFYLLLLGGAIVYAIEPQMLGRFATFLRSRALLLGACLAATTSLLLIWAMILSPPDGRLHLWLLDNGHSNAQLIQAPSGAQILVDGGPFPSRLLTALGDRMPFYDREIELLVITQPDEWDIAALAAVLERYAVRAALITGQENLGEVYKGILQQLADAGTEVVVARAGYRILFAPPDTGGEATILEVLHPQAPPGIADKFADHALVLRLRYKQLSILLASDLSGAGQSALLEAGVYPQASVLLLPQHGGAHSLDEGFLGAVQPQLALLQAERGNRRGDPDPDTLNLVQAMLDRHPGNQAEEALRQRGTRLLRTDESGIIHLSSDGIRLRWMPSR